MYICEKHDNVNNFSCGDILGRLSPQKEKVNSEK